MVRRVRRGAWHAWFLAGSTCQPRAYHGCRCCDREQLLGIWTFALTFRVKDFQYWMLHSWRQLPFLPDVGVRSRALCSTSSWWRPFSVLFSQLTCALLHALLCFQLTLHCLVPELAVQPSLSSSGPNFTISAKSVANWFVWTGALALQWIQIHATVVRLHFSPQLSCRGKSSSVTAFGLFDTLMCWSWRL